MTDKPLTFEEFWSGYVLTFDEAEWRERIDATCEWSKDAARFAWQAREEIALKREAELLAERQWVSVADGMPHSNVPVLAYYVNILGKGRRVRAQYAALHSLRLDEECEGACACGECEGEWSAPGWYETNEHEKVNWWVDEEVTHWMPLPDPPSIGAKENNE